MSSFIYRRQPRGGPALPSDYGTATATTTSTGTTTTSSAGRAVLASANAQTRNLAYWSPTHPPITLGSQPTVKARTLIILGALLAAVFAFGQSNTGTMHVSSFPGVTIGQKLTNAQAACSSSSAGVPCILVIDAGLNAYALGTVPPSCANCYIVDYRSGGPSFGLWQQLDAYAQGGADAGGMVNVFQTNPGDYAASLPVTTSITGTNYADGAAIRGSVLTEGSGNTAAGIVGRSYNNGVNTLVSAFRTWVENDGGNPTESEGIDVQPPAFYTGNPVTAEGIHIRSWGASGALHSYALHIDDQGTATNNYALVVDGGVSTINGTLNLNGTPAASRWSTSTASLGGSALTAGQCSSTIVAVAGIGNPDVVIVSPRTYPGAGFWWGGYISSTGNATVEVCAAVAGTPAASVYDVKIMP